MCVISCIAGAEERLQRELVKNPGNDAQEWSDNVLATKSTMAGTHALYKTSRRLKTVTLRAPMNVLLY